MISISAILSISYQSYLNEMTGNRSFPDNDLEDAYQAGNIVPIFPNNIDPDLVGEIVTKLVWSMLEEVVQTTENQKINYASTLLKNSIRNHSAQLNNHIRKFGHMTIIEDHIYIPSIYQLKADIGYGMTITTNYVK